MDKEHLSLTYVKAQLRQEDLNFKRKEKERKNDVAQALVMKRLQFKPQSTSHKNRQSSSDQEYHQGRKEEKKPSGERPDYICFYCGGKNHVAKYCCNERDQYNNKIDNQTGYKPQEKKREDKKEKYEEKKVGVSKVIDLEERENRVLCVKTEEDNNKHT